MEKTSALTVCLQQLLLGGDGEWAVFGGENHGQADVVLLWGGGPSDEGQQTHRVGLRGRAESLHAEPGGEAETRGRRKRALTWRREERTVFRVWPDDESLISTPTVLYYMLAENTYGLVKGCRLTSCRPLKRGNRTKQNPKKLLKPFSPLTYGHQCQKKKL